MSCGSTMYRIAQSKSFCYKCGLYQQSHGKQCAHNRVDGSTATRFGLSCVRQKLVSPMARQKLRQCLEKPAKMQPEDDQIVQAINQKQSELYAVIQ